MYENATCVLYNNTTQNVEVHENMYRLFITYLEYIVLYLLLLKYILKLSIPIGITYNMIYYGKL
jgi:hypothetical protein